MKGDQYQAIECSQYDIYEIAIMRGQTLNLAWHDASGCRHQHRVRPTALNTRNGEEFLTFYIQQDHDKELMEIRLDRIVSAE
ncbi:MAG TPA: hypothetical protein VIQ03_16140 [Gammaproteobacteria bacterium]